MQPATSTVYACCASHVVVASVTTPPYTRQLSFTEAERMIIYNNNNDTQLAVKQELISINNIKA